MLYPSDSSYNYPGSLRQLHVFARSTTLALSLSLSFPLPSPFHMSFPPCLTLARTLFLPSLISPPRLFHRSWSSWHVTWGNRAPRRMWSMNRLVIAHHSWRDLQGCPGRQMRQTGAPRDVMAPVRTRRSCRSKRWRSVRERNS